ncbi:glycosyltransferase family 2 protein [Aliarcobacter cryaerophilus]|uniref:glycosyltransferase family 2 protein n=1 Tax=Aliarcobacter cryaerophilus TaxID=28198 RepID=UPI0021B65B03|nr:glycosyltransferase family 2 protein [Aliarcobacter cryaerophilus]MCT7471118.1 glycosyltransferase family 2 protein [Aliarcobacter cryaerophilus]
MENEVRKDETLPLVSVFIPAYNHEKYVAEAIQSVIDQDYKNIELIIINDGSKDNTHEVIMSFEKKCNERFVRFEYRNRENKGLSATLNEGVSLSKGKYFSAIASDDVLLPSKISLLVEKLENLDDSYVVAFGDAIFIDDESNEVYIDYETGEYTTSDKGGKSFLKYYTKEREFNYKDENEFGTYKTLLGGNYLPAMSAVIKLEQIKEVDAWTSGNTIEDWEMWLKLSKNYKFAYVDKSVALYRWHENNSSKTTKRRHSIDSINLLVNEKNFAISNSNANIYYKSLVNKVFGIFNINKMDFIIYLFKYSFNIYFLKQIILKLKYNYKDRNK